MRRLGIGAAVVSIAVCIWFACVHGQRSVPAIAVNLNDSSNRWGGTDYLPAVDGYSSKQPGRSSAAMDGKQVYDALEWYKVRKVLTGEFVVLVHYRIMRDGKSQEVDCTLPVHDHDPVTSDWLKVDDASHACAYMSRTTLFY